MKDIQVRVIYWARFSAEALEALAAIVGPESASRDRLPALLQSRGESGVDALIEEGRQLLASKR